MGKFELCKTDDDKDNTYAPYGEHFILGVFPEMRPDEFAKLSPVSKDPDDRPGEEDPEKGVEKEKVITAVPANPFPAEPLETLFPEDKEYTAPA